jgi:hypothetical protein
MLIADRRRHEPVLGDRVAAGGFVRAGHKSHPATHVRYLG